MALVVGNSTYKVAILPVADPRNDAQDMSNALKDLVDRSSGVKIMILDASRNNPLADRLRLGGGATSGLAPIDKSEGMLVAYTTAPDNIAQDSVGRNSPFTAALLKRLQDPGVEIGVMFRRVAHDVNLQTKGRQSPETSNWLTSEYYLNQKDRMAWERIKDRGGEDAVREFLMKYPLSPLADPARKRLDEMDPS